MAFLHIQIILQHFKFSLMKFYNEAPSRQYCDSMSRFWCKCQVRDAGKTILCPGRCAEASFATFYTMTYRSSIQQYSAQESSSLATPWEDSEAPLVSCDGMWHLSLTACVPYRDHVPAPYLTWWGWAPLASRMNLRWSDWSAGSRKIWDDLSHTHSSCLAIGWASRGKEPPISQCSAG